MNKYADIQITLQVDSQIHNTHIEQNNSMINENDKYLS